MKLAFLSRHARRANTIETLYGAIVAQARHPIFYLEYGVPDTVNGRFEMLLLHVALLVDRLAAAPDPIRGTGQDVFDRFCQDMDDILRERGVSDVKVPKEMRRVASAFYGRQAAYREALARPEPEPLLEAVRRNVYGGASAPAAARMAAYMRMAAVSLQGQAPEALARGQLAWPAPDGISSTPYQ
jgi:cytochrome b pre-mRNA-processing protein 3